MRVFTEKTISDLCSGHNRHPLILGSLGMFLVSLLYTHFKLFPVLPRIRKAQYWLDSLCDKIKYRVSIGKEKLGISFMGLLLLLQSDYQFDFIIKCLEESNGNYTYSWYKQ